MIRTASTRALAALLLLLALAAPTAPALADEPVLTRRALELRDGAGDSARSLAALPARAALTRLDGRQGAWVQVRTAAGATGWVHLFDLAPASGAGSDNSVGSGATGALRGVTGLFGGSGVRQAGTTAGIRGLGAEDIANAQPNPRALEQVAGWRQGEGDARTFAQQAGLQPVAVEPLPAPARAAGRTGGGDPASREMP